MTAAPDVPRWTSAVEAVDRNATVLHVESPEVIPVDSIVKVPRTGELLRVTHLLDDGWVIVERGFERTIPMPLVAREPFYIIGNANVEAA